jgi:branched-chain amino acid transport system permease protein
VGINVVRTKILVSTVAAGIAGIGGGLFALYGGAALPQSFDAVVGLVWFAVLVTNGVRTNNAALAAGLVFVFLPDILNQYLSPRWGSLPTALFGLGAVLLAKNPDGAITMNARQIASLVRRALRLLGHTGKSDPDPEAATAQAGGPLPTPRESAHV